MPPWEGTIDALCIGDPNYIWNQFGNANFGEAPRFNIQNQTDIADWPCFARYYVKFPLAQVPPGKVIFSATLTLHQFGGSSPSQAYRSMVHVLSLAEDWNEANITWNNAPLGVENVSRAFVDVVSSCSWPCVPRTWDLTWAAAMAYSAGSPDLSLALYSVDAAYHSGKHFIASEEPDWNAVARPTLTITGRPPGRLDMGVAPPAPPTGAVVTFFLAITGTGESLSLIDQLPAGNSGRPPA